jgi:hypothetical protein
VSKTEQALQEKYGRVTVDGLLGNFEVVGRLSNGRLRVRDLNPDNPDDPEEHDVAAAAVRTVDVRRPRSTPRAVDSPRAKAAPRQRPAGKRDRGPRAGGSAARWRMLNSFVDFTLRGLRDAELKVWVVLFRESRDGVAFVSQRQLAERCGKSRTHVGKAVKALEEKGLLEVVERGHYVPDDGGGSARGKPSSYRLRAMGHVAGW